MLWDLCCKPPFARERPSLVQEPLLESLGQSGYLAEMERRYDGF